MFVQGQNVLTSGLKSTETKVLVVKGYLFFVFISMRYPSEFFYVLCFLYVHSSLKIRHICGKSNCQQSPTVPTAANTWYVLVHVQLLAFVLVHLPTVTYFCGMYVCLSNQQLLFTDAPILI